MRCRLPHLAQQAGAPDELIAGALLHDIGHLMHGLGEDIAEHGVDGKHEDVGAEWLEGEFPQVVIDCVRLHVAAKRYLTATDPGYLEGLSATSLESLRLQGGPFSDEEVADFERSEPNWEMAIQARRWDDEAKVVGLEVPAVESYRDLLERICLV